MLVLVPERGDDGERLAAWLFQGWEKDGEQMLVFGLF